MLSYDDWLMFLLRGVIYVYGFYFFLVVGVVLVFVIWGSVLCWVIIGYIVSFVVLFGISVIYYWVVWFLKIWFWICCLDYSMIFVVIVGFFLFFVFVLGLDKGEWVVEVIWFSVVGGIFVKFLWINVFDWVSFCMYVVVLWVVIVIFLDIVEVVGNIVVGFFLLGGVFYSVGVVVYVINCFNFWLQVFGYYEIFYVFVIMGVFIYFVVVIFFVVL